MKKTNIILICLLLLFGSSSCSENIVQENSFKSNHEKWQEAYANYLNEASFRDFYVGDINNDDIPEVVIRYDEYTNGGAILSFVDNELQVLELNIVSAWGDAGYLEESNQIILLEWYGHTYGTFGSVDFYLYEWTPNGYIEVFSLVRESGNIYEDGTKVYGQGYINGEEVSFDEFENTLTEMYALLEKSTWFPMVDANETEDYLEYLIQWNG